jgi:hypothetical protein
LNFGFLHNRAIQRVKIPTGLRAKRALHLPTTFQPADSAVIKMACTLGQSLVDQVHR